MLKHSFHLAGLSFRYLLWQFLDLSRIWVAHKNFARWPKQFLISCFQLFQSTTQELKIIHSTNKEYRFWLKRHFELLLWKWHKDRLLSVSIRSLIYQHHESFLLNFLIHFHHLSRDFSSGKYWDDWFSLSVNHHL